MINQQKYPSILLENVVEEFSKLPGIGKKTALRFALYLLKNELIESENLGNAILKFRTEVNHCQICHNVCDDTVCEICNSNKRDNSIVCVVENVADVMAIENTQQFKGLYHVLGGVISPMNGVSPTDLEIASLVSRVAGGGIKEVILALSPDMEGDTTCLYIYKKLAQFNIDISTIARGVSVGDSLEYADEITLGRSIVNRVKYSYEL
ncbi:MAG: recombination mediator RecR [Prevotellaceae bacterium]|jgi:recombination protein RecR|nr:recombination mediator RecR [Prevotellaceae bacterium]